MSDRFHDQRPEPTEQAETPTGTPTAAAAAKQGLPAWLARRVLMPGETVALVRGPKTSPLEPYLTHPALFLAALVPASISLAVGRALVNSWKELPPFAGVIAILLVFGTIIFLASMAGYFTRLVITDRRLIVLQGREVYRSRNIKDLPPFLLRRHRGEDGLERAPTIDLNAVNTLLGGTGDGYVDAETILTLSKKLDKMREADRTERTDER
jgi:hypothetical protein